MTLRVAYLVYLVNWHRNSNQNFGVSEVWVQTDCCPTAAGQKRIMALARMTLPFG
jgi:hypothetical protein